MSIVIPAADLARTVITIRCDSPHGAPQVECALDKQSLLQQQQKPLPSPLDTELCSLTRSSSSSSLSMDSPRTPAEYFSMPGSNTRADLNVERGLDQRGHYVRLCFSSMSRNQSGGLSNQDIDFGTSYINHHFDSGLAHNNINHAPTGASIHPAYVMDMDMDTPDLMGDMRGPLGDSMNFASLPSGLECMSEADIDNMVAFPQNNTQLTSTVDLDSLMNELDFSRWDELTAPSTVSDNVVSSIPISPVSSRSFSHHRNSLHQPLMPATQFRSEPASPEMPSPSSSSPSSFVSASSSSSSSGTNSPATPIDLFTPTPTPTSEYALSPGGFFSFGPGIGPDAFAEALGSASVNKNLYNPADFSRPLQSTMSAPGLGLGATEEPSPSIGPTNVVSVAASIMSTPSHTPPHSQPQTPYQSHSLLQNHTQPQSSVPGQPTARLLPCPQPGCRRQFKSTSTLSGHLKTHAGKGTRFACSFAPCTEKFSRRHDQLRHEVYKHGKRCEWVCPRCSSFFSYERSLEKHTCTMDKSRRGSAPYAAAASTGAGSTSEAGGPATPCPASASDAASSGHVPARSGGASATGVTR